jgi:hypothetical protein
LEQFLIFGNALVIQENTLEAGSDRSGLDDLNLHMMNYESMLVDHPEMARDPNNIKFVKGRAAHLYEEHGGRFGFSEGPLIERYPIVPKP